MTATTLPATDLVTKVRQHLAVAHERPTSEGIATAIRANTGNELNEPLVRQLVARLSPQLSGAGQLADLLADPAVTDVLVSAGQVWVDSGSGLHRAPIEFADEAQARSLAQRLATQCGRRLDDAQPWVDARLPDGSRLHAVLPPVSASGVCLSIRTFRHRAFGLAELTADGALTNESEALVRSIVSARLSYLVTGGTGSGKTTLLSSLLSQVPVDERILVVEDVTELRPSHPHVVSLQSKTANSEGAGAIGMRDLVRQALRMRPDRIVVGECRGAELIELLSALNTGHDGSAGTVHANSTADVVARLEALAAFGGLARDALHAQLASALRCVIHLQRVGGRRTVTEVGVFARGSDGRVSVLPAWRRDGGVVTGRVVLHRLLERSGAVSS